MSAPAAQTERYIEKLTRELGEPIIKQLNDAATEDIVLNPDGRLWVKSVGNGFPPFGVMTASQTLSALGTRAAMKGTVINHDKPILETDLPLDGSRFEGIIAPVVPKPVFAIRFRPRKFFTLNDYARAQILTNKQDPINRPRERDHFPETNQGCVPVEMVYRAYIQQDSISIYVATGS